jgi:opacity protein-like surface antigen
MKKTIITAALVVALTGAVQADDYDNTSISMAAESATMGISLSTNDTSRSIDVYTMGRSLDFGAGVSDNGTNRDYSLSAGRTMDIVNVGPVGTYVDGEVEYNWGDTFTKSEMHFTPTLGGKMDLGIISPYAEVNYLLKSVEGDFTSIDKVTPTMTFGTKVALTTSTSLNAKLTNSLNSDWESTDKEVSVGLTVKF